MQVIKEHDPAPVLRIYVGSSGVLKIEGAVAKAHDRQSALALTERLMPAIRRLDKAIRREFV